MILKTMLNRHLEQVRKFCDKIRGYGPHSQMEAVEHLEFLLKIIDELVDQNNQLSGTTPRTERESK